VAFACLGGVLSIASGALASGGAGSLDRSFGDHGRVRTLLGSVNPVDGDCVSNSADGVAVQSDGKIVVAGAFRYWAGAEYDWTVGVVRYLADGSLDPDFASDGVFTAPLTYTDDLFHMGVAIRHDHKIVVSTSTPRLVIMRLQGGG
jgi:hypothetical protein